MKEQQIEHPKSHAEVEKAARYVMAASDDTRLFRNGSMVLLLSGGRKAAPAEVRLGVQRGS